MEILEERDGYRVRLVLDEFAEEPYDDGAWPVLRIEPGNWGSSSAVTHMYEGSSRPHDLDGAVENAVWHWMTTPSDSDWPKFEKWLRAYLGVTRVETYYSGSFWYVAYDSAQWRKWACVDPERLPSENPLAEIKAWVEGDVWSWVVEKQVAWTSDDWWPGTTEYAKRNTWEVVDSCGGYYGSAWAEKSAREAFEFALRQKESA